MRVADGPTSSDALALFDAIIGASKKPEKLFVLQGNAPSFVLVAGRAYVDAHLGRLTAAIDALFRVGEVQPTIDYFAWARSWLEKPGAAASVDPDKIVDNAHRWATSFEGTPEDRPLIARGEPVLRKLAEAHRPVGGSGFVGKLHLHRLSLNGPD